MQLNDLKLLLALGGNKRLPHLEKEIFSSGKLIIDFYVRSICKECNWYAPHDEVATMVMYFSEHNLCDRWLQAEQVIRDDVFWMGRYVRVFGKIEWN